MIPVRPDSGRPLLPSFPSVFWAFPYPGYPCNPWFSKFPFFPRNEPPNPAKYFSEGPEMTSHDEEPKEGQNNNT